ncbi:hypothetical protein OSB04_016215 [Centaurea solstitialis]|uniref:AB hydrolase-1 domain-containing protein n=1 Tax=Centaurea solstitialis TaxID=347529 RepID=A0AA38WH82_9ASTR|nr:hypothetical protein OSB04_016215 [Centaurea solstitialis]
MGILFTILTHLLHGVMKLVGLTPQTLEIEPDTLMNIWLPKEVIVKQLDGKGKPLYIPPKKPAVLLIHCFAMDGIFLWFPQVLALTTKYSVYVPDLLFFGGSTTGRTERSARFQAEFLAKGMEILGVQKVAVVGLSYGGMVAFEMAKMYPNLVHSMVVSSTVVELTESISRQSLEGFDASSWSDLLLPENVEGFKRTLSVGAHKLPWIPNFVYRGVFENMFNNRKERSELLTAMIVPDRDANTNTNYSQRILMLWGDDDKIFNLEVANNMKIQLGANTTLKYIKNAGHLLSLEQPFAYNRHLKKFLANSM